MHATTSSARLPVRGRRALLAPAGEVVRSTVASPGDLRALRMLGAALLLVVLAMLLLAGLLWRLAGGSWAVVETPSMGRAIPVGSLIFTERESLPTISVGDVVSYHPRNLPSQTYTHRVVARFPDGTLQVRGDINGAADPLPVAQDDLVGVVVARWLGVGWLLRALPYLIVGAVVILVATTWVREPERRSAARVLGVCALFCISILVLRPFVHPVVMAVVADPERGPLASVVSAGLMPTRVTGAHGAVVELVSGQTGVIPVVAAQAGGAFRIDGVPHLDLAWGIATVLCCALPLLWCLVVGLAPDDDPL